jgi:hypothetical protein
MAYMLKVGDVLRVKGAAMFWSPKAQKHAAPTGSLIFLEKFETSKQGWRVWRVQVIHAKFTITVMADLLESLINKHHLGYFTKVLDPENYITGMVTNSPTCNNCEPETCSDAACAEAEHGEPENNGEREICYWCQGPTRDLCGGRSRYCVKCKK